MAPSTTIPEGPPEPISASEAAAKAQGVDLYSLAEFRLTILIFVFALISMTVFYLLIKHEKATPYTLRLFVIIILVFGTLLVVSSAYSTEQIAPVVGFFGTIAGYLLGRTDRGPDNEKGHSNEK